MPAVLAGQAQPLVCWRIPLPVQLPTSTKAAACPPACPAGGSRESAVQGFPLLLGADVCYSLNQTPLLFSAAAGLLARTADARFLLGYVSRRAFRLFVPYAQDMHGRAVLWTLRSPLVC